VVTFTFLFSFFSRLKWYRTAERVNKCEDCSFWWGVFFRGTGTVGGLLVVDGRRCIVYWYGFSFILVRERERERVFIYLWGA